MKVPHTKHIIGLLVKQCILSGAKLNEIIILVHTVSIYRRNRPNMAGTIKRRNVMPGVQYGVSELSTSVESRFEQGVQVLTIDMRW